MDGHGNRHSDLVLLLGTSLIILLLAHATTWHGCVRLCRLSSASLLALGGRAATLHGTAAQPHPVA